MAEIGATDGEIAKALEIDISTLRQWQVQYPDFAEACKLGKKAANERVERRLFERAVGFEYEEVTTKTLPSGGVHRIVTRKVVPPDPTAAKFWLTNQVAMEWKNKPVPKPDTLFEQWADEWNTRLLPREDACWPNSADHDE